MIDYNKVLEKANAIFGESKSKDLSVGMRALMKMQPPKIESDEAKSILRALIEELNEHEEEYCKRIRVQMESMDELS